VENSQTPALFKFSSEYFPAATGNVWRIDHMYFTLKRPICLLAAGAALWAATGLPAQGAVKHRYTFNDGNANDSVGTAHGTVIDPGTPSHEFTVGGQLDMSANAGGNPGDDAYVNLPNLIIQGASQSGTSGALSLEFWFTVSENRLWSRLGDFAGPLPAGGSEDVTNNGAVNDIYVGANSGRRNQGLEISNNFATPGGGNTETTFGLSGPAVPALPNGIQHHVVATFDKNDTDGGTNPGGTMRLFFNGAEVLPGAPNVGGSRAINPSLDLNALGDEDNWLGRSQWPDLAFDGSFNEFSIYDHPLSAAEVTTNFNGGPVPVPLPTLIVNTVTGATAIKNLASGDVAIDYYEISSPGGRLNPTTWNSLSDQNIDAGLASDFNSSGGVDGADLTIWRGAFGTNANGDADGDGDSDGNDFAIWQRQVGGSAGPGDSWDEAGGISDNLLVELFLNGETNLSANEQVSLGNAFRVGGAQDLTFKFGIKGEGALTLGLIQYVTTGPASAVPEPAALGLAMVAAAAILARRRRS
jgi:hypothetical protein